MALRKLVNEQRTIDYKIGTYKMAGGVPKEVDEKTPWFVKDYHDYYEEKLVTVRVPLVLRQVRR